MKLVIKQKEENHVLCIQKLERYQTHVIKNNPSCAPLSECMMLISDLNNLEPTLSQATEQSSERLATPATCGRDYSIFFLNNKIQKILSGFKDVLSLSLRLLLLSCQGTLNLNRIHFPCQTPVLSAFFKLLSLASC